MNKVMTLAENGMSGIKHIAGIAAKNAQTIAKTPVGKTAMIAAAVFTVIGLLALAGVGIYKARDTFMKAADGFWENVAELHAADKAEREAETKAAVEDLATVSVPTGVENGRVEQKTRLGEIKRTEARLRESPNFAKFEKRFVDTTNKLKQETEEAKEKTKAVKQEMHKELKSKRPEVKAANDSVYKQVKNWGIYTLNVLMS